MSENFERNRKRTGAEKVHTLLNPRNVVIVGATDKPGNWAQRIWRNLLRYDFPGAIYPFNPSRDTVWGKRCYRSFEELPEPPDHLTVLVPAARVPDLLREAAVAGASSATVITAGFDESPDPERREITRSLLAVLDETGIALSGPNCLGNFNATSKFFCMPDDRQQALAPGPVAIVAQSGGIVLAIKRSLEERGLDTAVLVTSGNETGLTTSDYITYFSQLPHVKVIACYLEAIRDPKSFLTALGTARAAGKPVVVLKLGRSVEGRAAAAAHTGALAGSTEAFDAVAGAAGALRVKTTDEMIECIEFLVHAQRPGRRIAGITYSGGMRGLVVDAAATIGLPFAPLSARSIDSLKRVMAPGAVIDNPLDGAFAATGGFEPFLKCVEIYLNDPSVDLLLMQEELPRKPGTARQEKVLRAVNKIAEEAGKPVVFISVASYGINDYGRSVRGELPHLAFLQEPDRALRTIDTATRYLASFSSPAVQRPAPRPEGKRLIESYLERSGPATLDELQSKKLLALYGLECPRESLAANEDAAVAAAEQIGFPVVLKIVSAEVPHKSDIGGVILGLRSADEVRVGYRKIIAAVSALPDAVRIDGVLVAEMASGGLELVLGIARDHDMGPVLAFGAGGVDVELIKDVAFGALPLDAAAAEVMIDRTRIGKLIAPNRGRSGKDRGALVAALVALSDLACDIGEYIEAVDINPFILRESGGVALDALVVLRQKNADNCATLNLIN